MDKVVHFEIPCEDKSRAEEFYKSVFEWKLNPFPEMNYTVVHTGEVDEENMPKEKGVINGGLFNKEDSPIKNPVITINVENIDEKLKTIKEAGGEIVQEKTKVGDMGYVAYFKDTEGNTGGIWEDIKK